MNIFLASFIGCLFALFMYRQAGRLWSRLVLRARELTRTDVASAPEARPFTTFESPQSVDLIRPMLLAALDLGRESTELNNARDIEARGSVIAAAYAWRANIDDEEVRTIRDALGREPCD
jgi:hypothetical protein